MIVYTVKDEGNVFQNLIQVCTIKMKPIILSHLEI